MFRATRASVASISGSPSSARPARVDRLAGTAARLFSTSPRALPDVHRGDRFEQRRSAPSGRRGRRGGRPGSWTCRGSRPGRRHELALVDQAVLQREQSEEEMAVGGGGHGMAPIVGGRSGEGPGLGAGPGSVASGGLSQVRHAFASVRRARRRTAAITSGWVRYVGSKHENLDQLSPPSVGLCPVWYPKAEFRGASCDVLGKIVELRLKIMFREQ